MILQLAEHSTEGRFPSTMCTGDIHQKTDVYKLSAVITESAALMCLHTWTKDNMNTDTSTCCQPFRMQSLPKI